MNVRTLIDSIVRQTVVLVAQLATSGGLRAPLAHVAEQVFLDLAQELERQGVSRKVGADMFGMALRTYQRRTQRIARSQTERGRSLWEAVFEYVQEGGVVMRDAILHRFRNDDEGSIKGVLRDLTASGLLFCAGAGRHTAYRVSTTDEQATVRRSGGDGDLGPLVWSVVFREGPIDLAQLRATTRLSDAELHPALKEQIDSGHIEAVHMAGRTTYRSHELVLALDDPKGWEAAVLDHYTAVVTTLAARLQPDAPPTIGGSTYHFELYDGHPLEAEVLGELQRFRQRQTELRRRVDEHNAEHGVGPRPRSVVAYYGQLLREDQSDET